MITFGNLSAAFLFLLLPILSLLWYWKGYQIKRALNHWISPQLQQQVVAGNSERKVIVELLLWNIIAALLIVALMDPRGNPRYLTVSQKIETPAREVIFLIDASASMKATDTRTGQSRFEIAKEIAQQTIEQLSGNSIGIFAFTTDLIPVSPPTFDLLFVHMMVNQLTINEGGSSGTDLFSALDALVPTLARNSSPKTVVLLTDGEDTDPSEKGTVESSIDKMINLNTVVEIVGLGSENGKVIPGLMYEGKPVLSVPNLTLLQQLAARGRGDYLGGSSNSSLAVASELANAIRADNKGGMKVGSSSHSEVLYSHYRMYPVTAALLVLLLYRLFPSFLMFMIVCTLYSPLNGETSFSHALYQLQAGDFPQAIREFSSIVATSKMSWEQNVALYNLAYAQMMQKQWRDALNTLDMIAVSESTPQYLTYHVLWNKAWVNFNLKSDPESTLNMLAQSEKAYCDWLSVIGAKDCTPPQRYNTFKKLILETPYKKPPPITFVYDPDPAVILKQLIALLEQDNITGVLIAASAFEQQSMALQRERFVTDCQFHPWNEVYPPFYAGVTLIKRDKGDQILQAKALLKFKEALEKLEQPPEEFKGSCWGEGNSSILQQLQSMNNSDTPPKKLQNMKEGDKPW